jgi:hypothetical protein
MSFAFCTRELRRCVWTMLETHIMMTLYFSPHFSSCAPSHFSHGPNHRSYGFDSRESGLVPGRFGVDPRSHHGVRPLRRHDFPARGVYSHFESSRFDGPYFSYRGSRPTHSNGEM